MSARAESGATPERVIGRVEGRRPDGPLLLVTAGIHGNEPDGVHALRRIVSALQAERVELDGRFVALSANRPALARNVRFVEEDMNRVWTDERLAALRAGGDTSEREETLELLEVLERELSLPHERVTFVDLHSTSGHGPPFTIVTSSDHSRAAALALRVPMLTGLAGVIGGTLVEWIGRRGHAAVVLEGGRSSTPSTIDNLESALWLALEHAGLLTAPGSPDLAPHQRRLQRAAQGLGGEVEIVHRHRVAPGEEFAMLPGFTNFDPVSAGQLLARTGPGLSHEVRAPWDGTLIMPRYQDQGRDGFFLARQASTAS